jgi:hypothetical protein
MGEANAFATLGTERSGNLDVARGSIRLILSTSVMSRKCLYGILGEAGRGAGAIDFEQDVAAGSFPEG